MKDKNKKKRNYLGYIIFLVIVIVVGVFYYFKYFHVGKGEEFEVRFHNLEVINTKGQMDLEKAEFHNNIFYTRTRFVTVDEEVVYKFDAMNDGTLDAKLLMEPTFLKWDMYSKKHINYKVTYLDGTEVHKGDTLKAGEAKQFKVVIKYHARDDMVTVDSQFYEGSLLLWYVKDK